MVSNTRSGRYHTEEDHKNKNSLSQNVASATTSSSKGRVSSSKASDGKGSDVCGSSTTNTTSTSNVNTRRSCRLENLVPSNFPINKNLEQQDKTTPSPLRRSGRIEKHSSTNSPLKTPKDIAKKNKKKEIVERATPVGNGDKKENVKCDKLAGTKRKRLNAATYQDSFKPLKKKAKNSDISQRHENVDDVSQGAGVNSSSDEHKNDSFAQDASSGDATSSSITKSSKLVTSHTGHHKERADHDLQEQEISACNTMDKSVSNSSTAEDNAEGGSKQVGSVQGENSGNRRENSPVTNPCDAVVVPTNQFQAYNADGNSDQEVGVLEECPQNSQRENVTERCSPDAIVVPLTTEEGYNADRTSEQEIGALREQSHSQRENATATHSSDEVGVPLTNVEEYNAERNSEHEGEDQGEKSSTQLENATVTDLPDTVDVPSTTMEKHNAEGNLELEGSMRGDQLKTQREIANADVIDLYDRVDPPLATEEDRVGNEVGDDIYVEDLAKDGTETKKLDLNIRAKVGHGVCSVCKRPGTLLCCKDCKVSYHLACIIPPLEKAPPGSWQCIYCSEKMTESGICSVSEGMEPALDTQVAEIKNCSVTAPDLAVSKEQFGRCLNELKPDSSTSKFMEFWVPVQLSNVQLEQYCSRLISGSAILRTCSRDHIGASGDILVSTRKCCDHPYLVESSLQGSLTKDLPPAEYLDIGVHASGKLMLLDKILGEMKRQGLKVLILFHQFIGGDVRMSIGDILDDFLRQRFGADSYERVDSGLVMAKKQNAMQMFNKKETGRFVFLIENRACLPSIKLFAVNAVIIFGSDWNPLGDLKALHRISIDSQLERLNVFRLYSLHTLEEKVLSFAKQDVILESNIPYISRKCHSLLSSGACHLFDELDKFHKDVSPSGCLKTSHQSSLLDDTVLEILTQISNTSGTITSIPAIISKAEQSGAAYPKSISLFGQKDIGIIDEEPPQFFWPKLLDGRYPQWRYITGHSQRPRRKVQHFEEQPQQVRDENDDAKRKRRKISLSTMDPVTWQPSTHDKRKSVSAAGVNGLNHSIHGVQTDHSSKECEVPRAEYGCGNLRNSQKYLHLLLAPEISKLCDILQLPDDVKSVAESFLDYIMNNHHVSQEPETLLQAFKLSLCWRAASFLKHRLDHKESLALVKKELRFECSESEAESVYSKLQMLKKKFSLPVNALLKCIEPNNLANQSSNQLQDKNKKYFSPVASELVRTNLQKEEGEIREIHRLPEHLLEKWNQAGRLVVNPVNFHQDKSLKNGNKLTLQIEKNNSSQVGGIIQKRVLGLNEFDSFLQSQQKQTSMLGPTSCGDNASASPHQVRADKHSRHDFSDGDEKSEQVQIPSPLQQECVSSSLLVSSSESCLPSVEVERSATAVSDEMETEQVQRHSSPGLIPVLLQSADAECYVENIEPVASGVERGQLSSSHMYAAPSIEMTDYVPPVDLERATICDGVHNEPWPSSSLPNMATILQSNDDVPSIELERFMESDGIDSGQMSCSSQQMETSVIQSTDAILVTEHERPAISNAGTENILLNSHLNVVSATDASPSIEHDQFVVFNNEEPLEQNSSQQFLNPSLQPDNAEQLQVLHPVHMQLTPSRVLLSTENGLTHVYPTLENDQACCNEMQSTTSSIGMLMQNRSGFHTVQEASSNQFFSQALECPEEDQIDLQVQRTDNLSGTHILQEMGGCLTQPLVINARLPLQGLHSDPLQNEMLRIRKEIDSVIQVFDNKKLQIKSEYENELDKLTRKYEMLFQDIETTYLEKKKTLEMIFGKVSMNQVLAKEFRSKFSDNKAATAKPVNLQGGHLGSIPQLQVSQPQFAQSVAPASSTTTTLMAAPLIVTLTSRPNPNPVLLSSQTRSTVSASVPSSVSVLPVQVVHNSSELFSSTLGKPHTSSMLPPLGNTQVGSGPHRSPAPHLNSFRPLASVPSPILHPECGGRLIQQQLRSSHAHLTTPTLLQVPATTQPLPSRDTSNRSHILAGDHAIPTVPVSLQVSAVAQPLRSGDTNCGTHRTPGNHAIPTVPVSLQVPAVAQPFPSRETEQHPGNFPVPTAPVSLQVSITTQTLLSKDSSSKQNQLSGNNTAPTVPVPIQVPTMSLPLPSRDDSRTELPESSSLLPTTLGQSACSDVDTPISVDNQDRVDPPAEHLELNQALGGLLPDKELGVGGEFPSAMNTNGTAAESNMVCVSSDEDT